jgi:hypothetical protein
MIKHEMRQTAGGREVLDLIENGGKEASNEEMDVDQ